MPRLQASLLRTVCTAYLRSSMQGLTSELQRHREPKSHSCSPPEPSEPAPQKNAAAKALLAKHFGASSDSGLGSSNTRPSNPKKLAQQRQIAVMKMRHKAKPLDPKDSTGSVPMDQRLHVFVRQEGQDKASERVFWLRKVVVHIPSSYSFTRRCEQTIWTGRALDMLASQFKLVISDTQVRVSLAAQPMP